MSIAPPLPALIGLTLALLSGPVAAQTGGAVPENRTSIEVVPPLAAAPAADDHAGLALRELANGDPGEGRRVLTMQFAEAMAGGDPNAESHTLIGRWFDSLGYWLSSTYTSVTNGLSPPSPEAFAERGFNSKDPDGFWQLVADAGYRLKEITTDVGVVPDVGFKFRHVRQLSDGDINWLERKLRKHEDKYGDPLSVAERAIIYTLLSINGSDFYYVEELQVKLLPLPTARFTLNPWDNDLSWENDTLLRAIQGQKHIRRKLVEEDPHF